MTARKPSFTGIRTDPAAAVPGSPIRFRIPVLVLILTLLLPAVEAGARSRPPKRGAGPAPETFITTHYGADGAPVALVRVSVPRKALVFRRDGRAYISRIRVTVIAERDGARLGGGITTASATADSYAQTRSGSRLETRQVVLLPDDDPVELRVLVSVVGTQRSWEQEYLFDPSIGSRIPWYFSGFAWNLSGDGPDAFELGETLDRLEIMTVLGYHPTAPVSDPGGIDLVYAVEDYSGNRRDLLRQPLPGRAAEDSLVMHGSIPASDLPFGYMTLHLRLVEAGIDSVAMSPPRHLFSFNLPWWDDRAWERHVSWLEGVIEGDDGYKDLKSVPRAERSEAWKAFWTRAGGDDARRRHLHRILEADRRFVGFGRGALSDRGRIFIKYGAPDRIDERDVDLSSPGSWKIWYYYNLRLSFVFYDAYGVGDYRLYSTSAL